MHAISTSSLSMGASLTRPARASALRARRHGQPVKAEHSRFTAMSRRSMTSESPAVIAEGSSAAAAPSPPTAIGSPLTSSPRPDWPSATPAPSAALYAMLARLGLPQTSRLEQELRKALTDRSWDASIVPRLNTVENAAGAAGKEPSNDLLAALGNSLLGLYASEHLATTYPNLPTRALKAALTAYVGPTALASVGRELGLAASGGGGTEKQAEPSWEQVGGKVYRLKGKDARQPAGGIAAGGVPIRWLRRQLLPEGSESTDVAIADAAEDAETMSVESGAERADAAAHEASSSSGATTSAVSRPRPKRKQDSWEDVVGRATRALVGLVYQEQVRAT